MSGISYPKFLAWNAGGGILWATGFVLLGYAAGSRYERVAHNATLFGLGLLAVIITVLIVKNIRDRRHRENSTPFPAKSSRWGPLIVWPTLVPSSRAVP